MGDHKKFSLQERFEQAMYSLGKKAGNSFRKKEDERARQLGVPTESARKAPVRTKKDYVFFGSFPQSIKPQNVTIQSQISAGVFKGSDGNTYYQKNPNGQFNYASISFSRSDSSIMRFTNGEKLSGGEYYKIEPIKWRIINRENGFVTLLSENILFFSDYLNTSFEISSAYKSCRNWERSYIRQALNDEFYYSAFSQKEQGQILSNYIATKDNYTSDKVYILSKEECYSYGLSCVDLSKHQTDFCGPYIDHLDSAQPSTVYNAWMTRSPTENKDHTVFLVNGNGGIMDPWGNVWPGIVPVIRVRECDVTIHSVNTHSTPAETSSNNESSLDANNSTNIGTSQQNADETDLLTTTNRIVCTVLCPLFMFAGILIGSIIFQKGGLGSIGSIIMLGFLVFSEVMVWKLKKKGLAYFLTFMNVVVTALVWIILGG